MIESLLSVIENNPEWSFVIVFVIAFAESLALIGLLVPGWILLVGVGGLIGANLLDFYPVVLAAYLGAVLGESLSYWLGFHYHKQILALPWVSQQQKMINYAHLFFEKYGALGVFIGRFLGPTRAVLPFIAGVSEMSKRTFLWVNCISGLLWAPLYLIPGILIGAAFTLNEEQSNQLLLVLIMIGVAMTLVFKYQKQFYGCNPKKQTSLLIKLILAWLILLSVLTIFVISPLWPLFLQILSVLRETL